MTRTKKPDSAVMRRIKEKVRNSAAETLNLTVGVDNVSVPITSALRQPGSREVFVDVPLRAIIELGHKNFAKPASNGMHRATAAICGLAATQGDAPGLRKVRVTFSDVWPALRTFVLGEMAKGHTVDFGRNNAGANERWLRVGRGSAVEIFKLTNGEMVHVTDRRSPARRLYDGARRRKWGYGPAWSNVIWARMSAHAADALR